MWLPSHVDITGNEITDKLVDVAIVDFKVFINQKINMAWQNHWNSIQQSNILKRIKKKYKKGAHPTTLQ